MDLATEAQIAEPTIVEHSTTRQDKKSDHGWKEREDVATSHCVDHSGSSPLGELHLAVRAPASGVAQFPHHRVLISELALQDGDHVTSIKEMDDEWLDGECRGRRGRFPRYRIAQIDEVKIEAERDNAVAQCELADRYYTGGGGVTEDKRAAFSWFLKAAAQGNVSARLQAAHCHLRGHGTSEDMAQAFALYKKLTEEGHVRALRWVGMCCHHGCGTTADTQAAYSFYKKALAQGCLVSYDVALNCGVGDEALQLVQQAAEQGIVEAYYPLAFAYEFGEGAPMDTAQGLVWWKKAAEAGIPNAQFRLGEIYELGQCGVQADRAEAIVWYRKAAEYKYHGSWDAPKKALQRLNV